MYRYFIDLTNGHGTTVDDEGQLFQTPQDASREALRVLAEVALDEYSQGDQLRLTVQVRPQDGEPFFEGRLLLNGRWIGTRV